MIIFICRVNMIYLLIFLNILLFSNPAPISNPLPQNGTIDNILPDYIELKTKTKTYHNTTPITLTSANSILLSSKGGSCEINFHLRWSTEVSSSVFSPPVIYPIGSEGKKDIFVATFFEAIEVIGFNGMKPLGWPVHFEGSSFQGSPILYDVDGDGSTDIGAVDNHGNLYWVRLGDYGQYLEDYHTKIPKLKVITLE